MNNELTQHLAFLVSMNPVSREAMKQTITDHFASSDLHVIDTHNTKAILFVFTADEQRYVLKIEQGSAKVLRDEAHWYDIAPARVKQHFVASGIEDQYAFVILKWLDKAQTIEELAMAPSAPDTQPAIDAYLKALSYDAELFASVPTVAITTSPERSFFRDKFYVKLEQAKAYPYLFELLTSKKLSINGKEYPGPEWFIKHVHDNKPLRDYLSPDKAGFIHGDLHADNLLVQDGEVYMVDPNGLDHLPIEYDHGRVLWPMQQWNAIVRGEFELSDHNGEFVLAATHREQYDKGQSRIVQFLGDQAYHRAMYSSAMQFMSRADHGAKQDEATALHLRGVEVMAELFDNLDIKY